jgi:hypothetical protein
VYLSEHGPGTHFADLQLVLEELLGILAVINCLAIMLRTLPGLLVFIVKSDYCICSVVG